jgi:hypothetical protein
MSFWFFRFFFRVLREASGSWLGFLHAFQKHPVYECCAALMYLKRLVGLFNQTLLSTPIHKGEPIIIIKADVE